MSQNDDAPVCSPLGFQREALLNNLITVLALLFWGRVILYATRQEVPRAKFGAIFLGGGVLLYVLDELYRLSPSRR